MRTLEPGMLEDTPIIKPSHDGIYPRCVWCGGEIYGPGAIDYSKGEAGCSAVGGCGKTIPESYVKLPTNNSKETGDA